MLWQTDDLNRELTIAGFTGRHFGNSKAFLFARRTASLRRKLSQAF
jgi:hypothetical protein